jgi:cysteine desulfurase
MLVCLGMLNDPKSIKSSDTLAPQKPVYLDYNATTPLHPELLPFVTQNIEHFGNASSVHSVGRNAKKLITQSRAELAKFLGCEGLEIVFTSSGSEGNNAALKGVATHFSKNQDRREIICSSVEHPSVLKTAEFLKSQGFIVHYNRILGDGSFDQKHFNELLSHKTALVSVQLVNNETGNIFPLKEITKRAHEFGALVHSDMVQALGKIRFNLHELGVDLATFAAHKFYSLKGAGVLYIKRGTRIDPLIHGGGQERSRRAGTENALAIATLGEAVRLLGPRLNKETERLNSLRNELQFKIQEQIPNCTINGLSSPRVANTLNVAFKDIDGETLLINLDTRGFAVSSGAACSSGSQEPSPVLRAMGLTASEASQSLRISLGWLTSEEDITHFLNNLISSVEQMRNSREEMRAAELAVEETGLEPLVRIENLL